MYEPLAADENGTVWKLQIVLISAVKYLRPE